ncbi:MAG: hypothetical protein MUE62_08775 [Burkholderiaceae bacterium]|jgi:hypothetical protein|nr:hypothetical protein [Burkholderiaceae bacterium]
MDRAPLAWIAEHPFAYPLIEVVHLAGIAAMLGSLLLVELRTWGVGAALPARPLARFALPVTLAGFALAAASGLLLFATRPAELLASNTFVIKMTLLMLAGLNAAAFHSRGSLERGDGVARAQTLASVALWLAVIGAGRWIAYA